VRVEVEKPGVNIIDAAARGPATDCSFLNIAGS